MKLNEISGDDESEVYNRLSVILTMVILCEKMPSSPIKDNHIRKYTEEIHKDSENLLNWVMKSKKISNLYYKLPSRYR
jgi:hypothetical protein